MVPKKAKNPRKNEGFKLLSTPEWIRTTNPRFRRPMLYPVELRVQSVTSTFHKFGDFIKDSSNFKKNYTLFAMKITCGATIASVFPMSSQAQPRELRNSGQFSIV